MIDGVRIKKQADTWQTFVLTGKTDLDYLVFLMVAFAATGAPSAIIFDRIFELLLEEEWTGRVSRFSILM